MAKLDKESQTKLLKDCARLTGNTRIGQTFLTPLTPTASLSYKFIVHAIKTIWTTGNSGEVKALEDLVFGSLNVCHEKGSICSIAFPAIMAEQDSFPEDLCAQIMLRSILNWCDTFPNTKLKRIKIATLNDSCFKAFNAEYLQMTESKHSQTSSQQTPTSSNSISETSFLSSDEEDEDGPAHKMRRREKDPGNLLPKTTTSSSTTSSEHFKTKKQPKSILKVSSEKSGILKREKKSLTETAAENIKGIIEKQVQQGQESQMIISNSVNIDAMSMSTDSLAVDNMESTLNQPWSS